MLKLRPEDLKEIEHFAKEHPTGILLSEMNNWNFQVNDVLIRHIVHGDGTKSIDMVNNYCQVPRKYRVMFIDALGVPWVKQLSVRGGLGEGLYCLAKVNASTYKYSVDPEQLEASLLGYKYDPRIEYHRMRASNPDYGKKK
jgi:hypothetical protein